MIWIILAAGLILRLISLNQSLWLDEGINVMAAKSFSLFGMVTQYAVADFHPPGWFVILWIWGKLFGYSEIAVRLPSVIFGIITIYIVYLIGKKLVSQNVGLVAALLLSINPLHIYYSQEARMYTLATLAVVINVLLFIKIIKGEKVNFIFLVLSHFFILMSDYVAYLIFPVQLIFLLLSKKTDMIKEWLIRVGLAGLLFVWWVPIFLNQIKIGSVAVSNVPGWANAVGAIGIKPLALTYVKFIIGRISFDPLTLYAVIFLPVGLLFLYLIWRGYNNLLMIWLLGPIILAALISLLIPVYSYFRLLFVLPAFVILIAAGINSLKPRWKTALLILTVSLEAVFAGTYLFSPKFHRENWKGLVGFLKEVQAPVVLLESSGSFAPFDYYAKGSLNVKGALKDFPAKDEFAVADLGVLLKDKNEVYLVDYLVQISDPERLVAKKLLSLGYKETDVKDFHGVGFVYHYVKND